MNYFKFFTKFLQLINSMEVIWEIETTQRTYVIFLFMFTCILRTIDLCCEPKKCWFVFTIDFGALKHPQMYPFFFRSSVPQSLSFSSSNITYVSLSCLLNCLRASYFHIVPSFFLALLSDDQMLPRRPHVDCGIWNDVDLAGSRALRPYVLQQMRWAFHHSAQD